nr:ATP synthase F0 subunit 8 [Marcia recens]UYR95118.1 ATP synthase subunit 8 [Marcia recens]
MSLTVAQFAPMFCLVVFLMLWCFFVFIMCMVWWSGKRPYSF